MSEIEPVDVVIVGAGAAGSVFASVLAESGKSVVILERGPARELTDLYSSQIWARRLKSAAPPVLDSGADRIWHNLNSGRGTGGAAIHHYAVWPRLTQIDFKRRSLCGHGLDWPFGYDELRPFYDEVQSEVGISGDAQQEVWRPPGEPYPLPPLLKTTQGKVIADGFARLGLRTAPIPAAILSRPYKGRPACLYDGWCDAGCPIGALSNPLVTYLARARKSGAVVRNDKAVTRVLVDRTGSRAIGVEYIGSDGTRSVQRAQAVVVCAFTVETCRILLSSTHAKHPDGLGNHSGFLGRHLMSHPSVTVYGLFEEDMQNSIGVSGGQLSCQDSVRRPSAGRPFGNRQWQIGAALKPNDIGGLVMADPTVFGDRLQSFILAAKRGLGTMTGICEDESLPDNRVTLGTQKDAAGMRLAAVQHTTSSSSTQLWNAMVREGLDVFQAAGAKSAWNGVKSGQHILGGTVMGTDPAASVLDPQGAVQGLPNLFVGGPSVFPTSSCSNPTYTVHALALRSARYLIRHWSGLNG